jgi:tetratricopeptide (TPR) repeat protein
MYYLGHGHSASDVVIFVPEEKVLLLGCFFFIQDGLPMLGTLPQLDVDRWLAVLDEVLADPTAIVHVVIGQHEIWPAARLQGMRGYLADLWPQVRALEAEGLDLATASQRLQVAERLAFLRGGDIDDDALAAYHAGVIRTLWRQLKPSASVAIADALAAGGAPAGRERFREVRSAPEGAFWLDEAELNLLGYRLLGQGLVDQAIAVFEMNVESFPESWNVYDSLGEAWLAAGDRRRAVDLYGRSLELNPDNANGRQALERIAALPAETGSVD